MDFQQENLPLFENSSDAIIVLQHGILKNVNTNAVKALRYEAHELVGHPYGDFVHPEDINLVDQRYIKRMNHDPVPRVYPFRLITKNGTIIWFEIHAIEILWEGEPASLTFFNNITERKAQEKALKDKLHLLETREKASHAMGTIIGYSKPMQQVFDNISKASRASAHVIVLGESGTGKELVSKAIHDLSDRADGAFVTVNCAAIPEKLMESELFGYKRGAFSGAMEDTVGLLSQAHGGTLFMDELGELDLNMQAKLLRAIEGGGFLPVGGREPIYPNIRIIAATNKNLPEMVKAGSMREDFFYRISIIPITLPPLRDRLEDLPFLIHHFLEKLAAGKSYRTIAPHVMHRLQNHTWPGNIRELQNVVHRYITMNRLDLPETTQAPDRLSGETVQEDSRTLKEVLEEAEKNHILNTLAATQWQKAKAAQRLGVHRKTLFRKLKSYGIE